MTRLSVNYLIGVAGEGAGLKDCLRAVGVAQETPSLLSEFHGVHHPKAGHHEHSMPCENLNPVAEEGPKKGVKSKGGG